MTAEIQTAKTTKPLTVHVLTKEIRHELGIKMGDLVRIDELNRYGWDDDVIKGFIKYEIFPKVYQVGQTKYLRRDEVTKTVNTLLRNAIVLYQAVEAKEDFVRFCGENSISAQEASRCAAEAKEKGVPDAEIDAYIKEHAVRDLLTPAAEG
jgi:hypothetical protein